jgi:hypothetical protein
MAEKTIEQLRKEFEGCISEIGANKTLVTKDEYNRGWNDASDNAIRFIRRYITGNGLFQIEVPEKDAEKERKS